MKNLFSALLLSLCLLALCAGGYSVVLLGIAQFAPQAGKGQIVQHKGKIVGYANVGQKFDKPMYFWGRPSAVGYQAQSSGGSNKATSNAAYLQEVQARIETFLKAHPYLKRSNVPAEAVTASASGLDPHISPAFARLQARRVAEARHISTQKVLALVETHIEKPFGGWLGVPVVNVLALNVALDAI